MSKFFAGVDLIEPMEGSAQEKMARAYELKKKKLSKLSSTSALQCILPSMQSLATLLSCR